MRPDELDVAAWFEIAEADLGRAHVMWREEDVIACGFFLQQSLEKSMKGFLIRRGWDLRKTHNLTVLVKECIEFESSLDSHAGLCNALNAFYVAERYPGFSTDSEDAAQIPGHLEQAERLLRTLRELAGV